MRLPHNLSDRFLTIQCGLLAGAVVAAEVFVRVIIAHCAFDLGAVLTGRHRSRDNRQGGASNGLL